MMNTNGLVLEQFLFSASKFGHVHHGIGTGVTNMQRQIVYQSFQSVSDTLIRRMPVKDLPFGAHPWNKKKSPAAIENHTIRIESGNHPAHFT